jgi:hypothetical protein
MVMTRIILSLVAGVLSAVIGVSANNLLVAVIVALFLGFLIGVVFVSKHYLGFAFLFGEIIGSFIPLGEPFGQAGYMLLSIPITAVFILGLCIGRILKRKCDKKCSC